MNYKAKAFKRHKAGRMNILETEYSKHLNLLIQTGEIKKYYFEEINLRIGDKCFYKPDFMVVNSNDEIEIHEIKGYWEDDARVKVKAVADKFPFIFYGVTREKGKWIKENLTCD